ncbi:uncharacterized protein eva1aa isoform X2 [Hippocampus comes]|uniref:uncharacterized protein eva1aa isoform X2 n=1 Tax=Hippocampus comes TaxID=109280 RepID=UPI00094E8B33|nr:PREDICTED: uncharacterized protein LOC109530997 isoform X2 [Hippocampus comes]
MRSTTRESGVTFLKGAIHLSSPPPSPPCLLAPSLPFFPFFGLCFRSPRTHAGLLTCELVFKAWGVFDKSVFFKKVTARTLEVFPLQQCVFPKKLLQEQSSRAPAYSPPSGAHDPNIVGDSPPEGTSVKRPNAVPDRKRIRETSADQERYPEVGRGGGEAPLRPPEMNPIINSTSSSSMALISNALAAYTYVSNHPERAALFFVCGVCLGLFLTLFALVVQISCRTDCQPPRRQAAAKKRARPAADSSSDSSDSDSDWDANSDLSARRHRRFERTLNMNVFTSAEELERAQRLEERERIIREIWMNGQPDVPGTRSLNRYY